jgi:predicted Zn-dependent protease
MGPTWAELDMIRHRSWYVHAEGGRVSEQDTDILMCRDAVRQCAEAGAEGCEVQITRLQTRTATWQTEAVTGAVALGPRESATMHLRLFYVEGRTGTATTTSSGRLNIQRVVESALTSAQSADPDPNSGLAPRLDVPTMGLGIYDRRNAMLTDEDRTTVVERNVQGCRSVEGVHAQLFRYTEILEQRSFCSSRGIELDESATRYSLEGTAVLDADESVRVEGRVASRHFADVASIPLGVGLGRQVARYRDPIALPEGELPAIIEPVLVARLIRAVAPAFDRSRLDAGKSFLTGEIDQPLGSGLLHLIDDAARSGGLATRGFDARGVPPVSMPLIREGRAGAFYTDVSRSVKMGTRPSGHEQTDGKAWPGNLLLRSGNRSRNMIFPELGQFIMLADIVADGLRADLSRGTLKLRAHTFLSEGVEVQGYLGVLNYALKWTELWGGIREIGSDQQRFGSVDASTWIVDGLVPTR